VCLLGAAGVVAALVAPDGVIAQPRHFRDQDLSGKDFSRQNMTYQDYSRANLEKSDLTFANCAHSLFKGANFRGATLKNTSFADADLSGADFRGADLLGTNFHNAKLWDANLSGVTLYLAGAMALLEQAHDKDPDKDYELTKIRKRIQGTLEDAGVRPDRDQGSMSLRGANLRNAQIFGNVAHVDLRRADLRGADLGKTEGLQQALLRGAVYDGNTEWKIDAAAMGAVKAKDSGPAK